MARISGIDIPKEKRGVIALTYIYGIGKSRAQTILKKADVNEDKKVNSILRFDFVYKVRSKNIDQSNQETVLELIGIDYLKNNDVYEINLIFNNNAHIALTTETIEARLEDQSEIK